MIRDEAREFAERHGLTPSTAWLTGNFEFIRAEALMNVEEGIVLCKTCAAMVPRYAAAAHLNWHGTAQ